MKTQPHSCIHHKQTNDGLFARQDNTAGRHCWTTLCAVGKSFDVSLKRPDMVQKHPTTNERTNDETSEDDEVTHSVSGDRLSPYPGVHWQRKAQRGVQFLPLEEEGTSTKRNERTYLFFTHLRSPKPLGAFVCAFACTPPPPVPCLLACAFACARFSCSLSPLWYREGRFGQTPLRPPVRPFVCPSVRLSTSCL